MIYRFVFVAYSTVDAPNVAKAIEIARCQRLFGANVYGSRSNRGKGTRWTYSSEVVYGSEKVSLLGDPKERWFNANQGSLMEIIK